MKFRTIFFILIFVSALCLSCHSSEKEVRGERSDATGTTVSAVQENKISQDSLSSRTLEKNASTESDTIHGVIYVSGNEPFTHLMLTTSIGKPYLVETDSSTTARLWQLQGTKVSIVGIKKSGPMGPSIKVQSFHRSP
jgi:hypothetical protein